MKALITFLISTLLLASCMTVKPQSSYRAAGGYTVKKTDTLYSIAWRYGLDYEQLAGWNQIDVDSPIYPGQRLTLIAPRQQTTVAGSSSKADTSSKSDAGSKTVTVPSSSTGKSAGRDPTGWIWPTRGKPLNTFLASKLDRRGIDIAGKAGQDVLAVADGRVVYSGNGLAGYGNLIIIKHSDTYLSAYAHCQERLVEEGASVRAGKLVARMGHKDNTAKLYFEIRRNGKPVDPMKYLPRQ